MFFRFSTALSVLLLLSPAAALRADEPKADAIMDKYVEVTGGRAAYEKIHSEVATGQIEISGAGLKGTLTSYRAAPDKSYTLIDFEGVGKVEEGSNGDVAWSINPMEGPRIKQGDERATTLRNDALHMETRWRDFYKKAELAGSEDVGGKPCYKVVLTPKEGPNETRFYDKASSLLVKIQLPISTPQGSAEADLTLDDYRDEDGIRVPHTITQKVPGADVLIKIDSVKQNSDIAGNRFDLPDDIKKLMKAAGGKPEGEKKPDNK